MDERRVISDLYRRVYRVVRRIPRGRVATYGQVAELAGIARGARVAGYAMRASPPGVPWHRVIGKRGPTTGGISIKDPVGGAAQRALLEAEGVTLTEAGTISLDRHGWLPHPAPKKKTARPHRGRAAR